MIISDLDHLQVVFESSQVEGGNYASAGAFADSLARGYFDYYYYYYYGGGASASTLTETNTYSDESTAAASSYSSSSASTYPYYW